VDGSASHRGASRVAWIAAGVAAAAATIALSAWTPSPDPAHTVCALRRTLGIDCPGCGMTRAAAALVRGEFGEATRLHPLVWAVAAQGIALWVRWGASAWAGVRPMRARTLALLAAANAVAFLAVWAVRLAW